MNPRKIIFDAVRKLRDGKPFTLAEVQQLDAAIDAFLSAVNAPTAPAVLANPDAFFGSMRSSHALGPVLSQAEVDGCMAILAACGKARWPLSWVAYALATAYHETGGTLSPIREYGRGKGRKYGKPGPDGQVAYGRGYVQLTWDYNYANADEKLGLGGKLKTNYDLALDPAVAADIMVRGMAEGWFTTKKLSDFLPAATPATKAQFVKARTIINGTDRAELIAGHALEFQSALSAGGWA